MIILIYISINFDVVSKYLDGTVEVESMMSEISLIRRLNNRGPFTLPCGVSLPIVHGYESCEPHGHAEFSMKRNTRSRIKDVHVYARPRELMVDFQVGYKTNLMLSGNHCRQLRADMRG